MQIDPKGILSSSSHGALKPNEVTAQESAAIVPGETRIPQTSNKPLSLTQQISIGPSITLEEIPGLLAPTEVSDTTEKSRKALAGSLQHELNSKLSIISGSISLIELYPDQKEEHLERIIQQCNETILCLNAYNDTNVDLFFSPYSSRTKILVTSQTTGYKNASSEPEAEKIEKDERRSITNQTRLDMASRILIHKLERTRDLAESLQNKDKLSPDDIAHLKESSEQISSFLAVIIKELRKPI